jgi:hypothetical protein
VAKRAYERRGGLVADGNSLAPASFAVHEFPTPEERRELLEKVRSGSGPESGRAAYRLQGDRSPEFRDALLAGLPKGNLLAPMLLATRFLPDPQVRLALLEATRVSKLGMLQNLLQVIHRVGPEAVPVLEERLAEARASARGDDGASGRVVLGAAVALVRLSASAQALDVLESLFANPLHPLIQEALQKCVAVCGDPECHASRPSLLRLLKPWLDSDEPGVVLEVAPALRVARPDSALQQLLAILCSPDLEMSRRAAGALAEWPPPVPEGARAAVIGWLRQQEGDVRCQYIASLIGDRETLTAIARRALESESPRIRGTGVSTLALIDAADARSIAAEALVDEPDSGLRRRLERWVSTSAR